MSAYIKELLIDLADDHLSIIPKIDILTTIQQLYDTGQITSRHIRALDMYISGYTCAELEVSYPDVRELLAQTFILISNESGYTDELFLNAALNLYPKFKRIIPTLTHKLQTYAVDL